MLFLFEVWQRGQRGQVLGQGGCHSSDSFCFRENRSCVDGGKESEALKFNLS